jgi:hypothetical protein
MMTLKMGYASEEEEEIYIYTICMYIFLDNDIEDGFCIIGLHNLELMMTLKTGSTSLVFMTLKKKQSWLNVVCCS